MIHVYDRPYFFASLAALIVAFSSSVRSFSVLGVVLSVDIHSRDVVIEFNIGLFMSMFCKNADAIRGLRCIERIRSMNRISVVMNLVGDINGLLIFTKSLM